MSSRAEAGFTLVEVMVALIIAAVLLPTLLMAYGTQADGIGYLRDKSVAHWVAANQMAETRITARRTGQIFTGKREGVATMAGRDWPWTMTSEATNVENFIRLDIAVAAANSDQDDPNPLYTLTGFVSLPAAQLQNGEEAP